MTCRTYHVEVVRDGGVFVLWLGLAFLDEGYHELLDNVTPAGLLTSAFASSST